MIDKTINNIYIYIYIYINTLQGFRGNTYNKNNKKNTLQGFGENTYSKNSKYKNIFFLSFLYIKGVRYKTWI